MALKLDAWAEDSCRDFLVTQVIRHILHFPHNADSGDAQQFESAIRAVVDWEANTERVSHLPSMPLAWDGIEGIGCRYETHDLCCLTAFFSAIQGSFAGKNSTGHVPGCCSCPESQPQLTQSIPVLPVGSSSKRARSPTGSPAIRKGDPMSPIQGTARILDMGDDSLQVQPPTTSVVSVIPCQCCPGCAADVAAHYQSLLSRGIVLDRMSLKDLQFACWILVNKAELTPLAPSATAPTDFDDATPKRPPQPLEGRAPFAFKVPPVRREHLLSHLRSLYYDRLLARRQEPTKPTPVPKEDVPAPIKAEEPINSTVTRLVPIVRPIFAYEPINPLPDLMVGGRVNRVSLGAIASSMCDLLEKQLGQPGQPLEGDEGRALSVYPLQCIDALQTVGTASVGDRRVPCLRTRPPYKYRHTEQ